MQVSCPGSSFGFDNIWEDGPVYARLKYLIIFGRMVLCTPGQYI